jgi:hypothetical protein
VLIVVSVMVVVVVAVVLVVAVTVSDGHRVNRCVAGLRV